MPRIADADTAINFTSGDHNGGRAGFVYRVPAELSATSLVSGYLLCFARMSAGLRGLGEDGGYGSVISAPATPCSPQIA